MSYLNLFQNERRTVCHVNPWIKAALLLGFALAPSPSSAAPKATKPRTAAAGVVPWWKTAVFYEIFPRSFQDTDGDGIGDINGITRRLDYLKELGIDAIWITPCFPSPLIDFGYDVSDYKAIAPELGTMRDMDRLIAEAKKRHMHVLLDLVVNHTSDQHPWFKQSQSSKDSPKRDWYIWRDGKAEGPPNNWQSGFLTPAWTLDRTTGQWYYHAFWPEQPDLNWRNAEVRSAVYDVVKFWLGRGVSGFRLDAVPSLFEDPELKDDPNAYDRFQDAHQVLREMHAVAHTFSGDRVLLGETFTRDASELAPWYGNMDQLDLALNFPVDRVNKLSAVEFRAKLRDNEDNLRGQPTYFFNSHDEIRAFDRYGDGVHNEAIAKLMATLMLCARATPVMYYGEEIGMKTTTPTRREDARDMDGVRNWPRKKGRDGERTPMQWDATRNAGFSSVSPWLPIPDTFLSHNVASEAADPASILAYYKRLLHLRHTLSPLTTGAYSAVDRQNPNVLSFVRKGEKGKPSVLVALNMSGAPQLLDSASLGLSLSSATTLLRSSTGRREGDSGGTTRQLAPFESALFEVRD